MKHLIVLIICLFSQFIYAGGDSCDKIFLKKSAPKHVKYSKYAVEKLSNSYQAMLEFREDVSTQGLKSTVHYSFIETLHGLFPVKAWLESGFYNTNDFSDFDFIRLFGQARASKKTKILSELENVYFNKRTDSWSFDSFTKKYISHKKDLPESQRDILNLYKKLLSSSDLKLESKQVETLMGSLIKIIRSQNKVTDQYILASQILIESSKKYNDSILYNNIELLPEMFLKQFTNSNLTEQLNSVYPDPNGYAINPIRFYLFELLPEVGRVVSYEYALSLNERLRNYTEAQQSLHNESEFSKKMYQEWFNNIFQSNLELISKKISFETSVSKYELAIKSLNDYGALLNSESVTWWNHYLVESHSENVKGYKVVKLFNSIRVKYLSRLYNQLSKNDKKFYDHYLRVYKSYKHNLLREGRVTGYYHTQFIDNKNRARAYNQINIYQKETVHIHHVWTRPQFRGKGYQKLLLAKFLLNNPSYHRIEFSIDETNLSLYLERGGMTDQISFNTKKAIEALQYTPTYRTLKALGYSKFVSASTDNKFPSFIVERDIRPPKIQ